MLRIATRRVPATAAALLVGLFLSACLERQPGSGQVAFQGADLGQYAGVHAHAGQRVVLGATVIENTGTTQATLDGAALVGGVTSEQAGLVEVRVRPLSPGDSDLVGAAVWPFEDFEQKSVPLRGFHLEPGAQAAVLYVVEVRETGVWNWPSVSLDYSVNGHSFQATARTGLQVCPPKGDCPPLEDSLN